LEIEPQIGSPQKAQEVRQNILNFRFNENPKNTLIRQNKIGSLSYPVYINEFWTAKQRQASSLHEISYRACFKPQLPNFFISRLTQRGDIVYDPFSGRGTTILEAGMMGRVGYANDINPLSKILVQPRMRPPDAREIELRLSKISWEQDRCSDIDLSMFYHKNTLGELISLRDYLKEREISGKEDYIDRWIRLVATNRLTGHSKGFFSVYTLPPNQATSQNSQIKINEKRGQVPEYRDVKSIIIKKTKQLQRDLEPIQLKNLSEVYSKSKFLTRDARNTPDIKSNEIQLTVTSPPFLDIVHYSNDNWLRCWFNNIDDKNISKRITMTRKVNEWNKIMLGVFKELFRITKPGGWVVFEVGEVRKGEIKLEEEVIPLGLQSGFKLFGVVINDQKFTKTANIWGIENNIMGTNTNRMVIFHKENF
jgi:hypothetical protein